MKAQQTRTTIYLLEQDRQRLERLKERYGLGISAAVRAGLALLEEQLTVTKGDAEMTLADYLSKYNAEFHYNGSTWCLSGTSTDGNYYETDDYEADTQEEAEEAAIEYLIAYHQH